jgi:hypothetical protein
MILTEYIDSIRVRKFREDLIKKIPRFPNNRISLKLLEEISFVDLLLIYVNRNSRFVPPRPRRIHIEPSLTADRRWKDLSSNTKSLFDKSRRGNDLTPHLSLQIFKKGFRPNQPASSKVLDRWADKDFLLNVMGYHYFHLSHIIDKNGSVKRTDTVLFAKLTRDEFTAIGFFDHSVFESSKVTGQPMEKERQRLWKIFLARQEKDVPPGNVFIPAEIMTSGHSARHVRMAIRYAEIIDELDPKLDDPDYVGSIFGKYGGNDPRKIKPVWHLNYLDFGLFDKKLNAFCILQKGWI